MSTENNTLFADIFYVADFYLIQCEVQMLSYVVKFLCKHTKRIKACALLAFVIFCFINVYNSFILSHKFNNPYEYLRREHVAKTSAVNLVGFNETKGTVGADSHSDYEFDFEKLHKLHAPDSRKYPEYNLTVSGDGVRAVPLWQRRLKEQRTVSLDENGPFYFLTELLQVILF